MENKWWPCSHKGTWHIRVRVYISFFFWSDSITKCWELLFFFFVYQFNLDNNKQASVPCRYLAPEYAENGIVSVRTDVYAFGMVLLQLISGRKVIDPTREGHQQSLRQWVSSSSSIPVFCDCHITNFMSNSNPKHAMNILVEIGKLQMILFGVTTSGRTTYCAACVTWTYWSSYWRFVWHVWIVPHG